MWHGNRKIIFIFFGIISALIVIATAVYYGRIRSARKEAREYLAWAEEKVWAVFLLVMIFSSCGSIIDLSNHQSCRQQGGRI